MFDTQYSPHNRISSNPGSPVKVLYGGKYDANGRVVLEKKGEENLYDYIQSFRDSVDLNVILARFTNGDVEALNKAQGFYADVTDFPKKCSRLSRSRLVRSLTALLNSSLLSPVPRIGFPRWVLRLLRR